MNKIAYIMLFASLLFTVPYDARGAEVNYAVGLYGGIAPSLGGDLHSALQQYEFGTRSGIDGINRSEDGVNTSNADRLMGATGGFVSKMLFLEHYQLRLAGNYTRAVFGGDGTTIYAAGSLDCEYSFQMYDMPFTFGISIPFWKDVKIIFSCGFAVAYAKYENRFESEASDWHGRFDGWGFPLVILLEGEYFITDRIAMVSSIIYYRGSTKTLKDEIDNDDVVDYARLDFTGYRFNAGITYYIHSI